MPISRLSYLGLQLFHTRYIGLMSISVQQDATMYRLLYFCKLLYMFRVVTPPIISSTYNCNYNIWYWSNFGKCSVWSQPKARGMDLSLVPSASKKVPERSWLRHCDTSQKVAGSIPDGVIGFFDGHNSSGRTMALGSTQPLAEMSTRNVSWG